MKKLDRALMVALCFGLCCGGCVPKAKVTVRIVDDNNQPIQDATVAVNGFKKKREGETDKDGCFIATLHGVTGQLDLNVKKQGFYTIWWYSYFFKTHTNNQWVPWNPTIELQLHKIGKPVPMVVKSVKGLSIPVKGQPVGYDLMVGDWVAPYGGGQTNDFIFFAESNIADKNDFDSHLLLTFSNPGDGLILHRLFWRDDYEMRLAAFAPADGYSNRWDFVLNAKFNPATEHREVVSTATQDDNYYFRVRTKQDEKGNVVSALYGKIYDGVSFDPGFWHEGLPGISFTYYLNPDGTRNTEFDTRSNLCSNPGTAGGKP
jgi:hypothetical protein